MYRPSDVCLASFLCLSLYTHFIRKHFRSNNCRPFCSRQRSNWSSLLLAFDLQQNWITWTGNTARNGAVGWGTVLLAGRPRVRFPTVSAFFTHIILPAALWPWGQLNLQHKSVKGVFPGGKDGWCVGLTTLPPSCADCLAILEPHPPGTLRTCPDLHRGGVRRQ